MNSYIQCKRIETSIQRAKLMLKEEDRCVIYAKKYIRRIEEKFIDSSDHSKEMNDRRNKLKDFEYWCSLRKCI